MPTCLPVLWWCLTAAAFLAEFAGGSCGAEAGGERRLWDREPSLWDVAQGIKIWQPVPPGDPQPIGTWGGGTAPNLSTQELKISLWGPPSALTLSLGKTDVWDRRRIWPPPLTLAQVRERVKRGQLELKYYEDWRAYDFPCPKPVGQVIVSSADLEGASQPEAILHCRDGMAQVEVRQKTSKAILKYLPMMTGNLIAVECDFRGLTKPVSMRLYRHRDTQVYGKSWQAYGGPDPEPFQGYDYSRDKNNGLLDPPRSGKDGPYFWIAQKLPAEKTFPNGFEYFMAGRIVGCPVSVETVDGRRGLGTSPRLAPGQQKQVAEKAGFWRLLPSYQAICSAQGSAATATVASKPEIRFTLLVSVVTTAEAADPLAEAKRLIDAAAQKGFGGLAVENAGWYEGLYRRREKGRIFKDSTDFTRSQIQDIFRSWACPHSGRCLPDPSRYEADARYAYLEQDWAPWHGLPCYNELYYTATHVQNRSDQLQMWYKLVPHWLPACKKNAREVFDLPGAALLHGYLPPIQGDEYAHCTGIWEFCMEIPAQVLKVLWDAYDYGGDEQFLADVVYPALRETAIFYSHYAALGEDGCYHVIPTVSAEHWGWTAHFERNRDSTAALCMFKWLLRAAADASRVLGRDADLRGKWLEVAEKMAPYPTYQTPEGTVFSDVRGVNPIGVDYNWFAGFTPTLLADDINLDSSPEQKQIMLRTARLVKGWAQGQVGPLLAGVKGTSPEQLINSRSGRIYLFPAIPPQTTIAFRDMQARGGFEVSAECIQGKITYVHLRARRNVACRLMNPWPGEKVQVRELPARDLIPHELDNLRGECVTFPAQRGKEYLLQRKETRASGR